VGKENEQVLDLKPVESGQVQEGAAGYKERGSDSGGR
jgi:hypothetical protein